jgi:hypothetical protein
MVLRDFNSWPFGPMAFFFRGEGKGRLSYGKAAHHYGNLWRSQIFTSWKQKKKNRKGQRS